MRLRIRAIRNEKMMTPKELNERSGTSVSKLSAIENGSKKVQVMSGVIG